MDKIEKFSYSKIECFEGCRYKYKLIYRDNHFIESPAIATDFGTLIHFIEETMARKLQNNEQLNRDEILNILYNIDDSKEKIYGVNILKNKYPEQWLEKDKSERTYDDKINEYVNNGMFRLYDHMMRNPNLEIVGIEQEFNLNFSGYVFHGFIDRVFRDKNTGHIYIEDIKTWSKLAKSEELTTPLQFVFYTLAAKELYNTTEDNITCAYELPLCDAKQAAGTKGFIARGIKKINKLLDEIKTEDFEPNPSPLCHWCIFSETFPNQPKEAKKLCPYFSHWTKLNKDFSVENEWLGAENHEKIMEAFKNDYKPKGVMLKPTIEIVDSARRFIIRR